MARKCGKEGCPTTSYWKDWLYGIGGGGPSPVTPPVNIDLPSIGGSFQVGEVLIASQGSWTQFPTGYTYQWNRGGVAISGATSSSYTLVSADYNTIITVTVTATNSAGSTNATSDPTSQILPAAPINTVAPVLSGIYGIGNTLSLTNGTWTGQGTITYSYYWERDGVLIAGATANTYQVVSADADHVIQGFVIGENAGGMRTAGSNMSLPIVPVPLNTSPPTITGIPKVNEILTAHSGTWTGSPTFTYQWYRDGVAISAATAITYNPVDADLLHVLTFGVIGTNVGGSASAISTATANVFSSTMNGQGYEVHWVTVADSILNGTGTADKTIAPNILYLWNGSTATMITNQNIPNGVTSGSPWKDFATEYVASFPGRKIVLVQTAKGGANLGPDGVDTDNWSAAGALRAPSWALVDSALAAYGLDYPAGIYGDAMINDVRVGGETIATLTTDFNNAVDPVMAKFPNSPFLYCLCGRNGTTSNTLLLRQGRDLVIQKARNNANFHCAAQIISYESLGYYQADALHPIQAGSEQIGISFARWHANSVYSKYARGIISMHFASLNTNRKNLIANEIDAIGTGIYGHECQFSAVQSDDRDSYLDWALLTSPVNTGTTFTANDHRTSNGTTYMRTAYVASTLGIRASQNDFCIGVYIKTMRSDATTLRVAFGASDTTKQTVIGQTTTGVFYRLNDNTLTVAPEAKLADNSQYVAYRSSSNAKGLYKNGSILHTATVTSVGLVTQSPTVGVLNQNGSPAAGVDMDYQNLFIAQISTLNVTTVYVARKARIDNWNV